MISINFWYKSYIFSTEFIFKEGQNLLKLLLSNFEMIVTIPILEETFCVKSFFSNNFGETIQNSLNLFLFSFICWRSTVNSIESSSSNICIKIFLKTLSSENFINTVTECFPANVISSFWRLKMSTYLIEFHLWNWKFGHVQANSELSWCDVSWSQFIEISEEFWNTNSLFNYGLSYSCDGVIYIVWFCPNRVIPGFAYCSFWIQVPAVIEISTSSKELISTINFFTKINVVYFIDISFIHVAAQDLLLNIFSSGYAQKIQNSKELMFGNMTIFGDVKILEHWFEMNSHDINCISVSWKDLIQINTMHTILKVLSSGKKSIIGSLSSHCYLRIFVNASDCECFVDTSGKIYVIEENFGIVGFVFIT